MAKKREDKEKLEKELDEVKKELEEAKKALKEEDEAEKNDEIEETTDDDQEVVEENDEEQEEDEDEEVEEEKEVKKKDKSKIIIVLLSVAIILAIALGLILLNKRESTTTSTKTEVKKSPYRLSGNSLEDFDLYFMQLENNGKNKIYSPLSIKYTLAMLKEGANGESFQEIENLIGDYQSKKYPNNEHMSFANAMFIRNTFKDAVKKEYTEKLKSKYNAEVVLDNFSTPDNINNWVSDKTFKLIGNLLDDVSRNKFVLVNALAIDMNWKNQMHCATGSDVPCLNYHVDYYHERLSDEAGSYYHNGVYPFDSEEYFYGENHEFNGEKNIKGADILADYNKYDIIKDLGEDKIRQTVTEDYSKFLKTEDAKNWGLEDTPEEVQKYVDSYVEYIKANYGKSGESTDFSYYEDDNIKAFAKDLKDYEGTTLQYVGIMPKEKGLTEYLKEIKAKDINKVIENLKEMKIDNMKEGYVTQVYGYIPFFKFEYELGLVEDLQKLGVKKVFEEDKADLSNMIKGKGIYIDNAVHKANIEFSNDGIKAAAATTASGAGATSGGYDYLFTVPVIKIDVTFNKPYMYLVRDKATGEVWFAGTVYEPIKK